MKKGPLYYKNTKDRSPSGFPGGNGVHIRTSRENYEILIPKGRAVTKKRLELKVKNWEIISINKKLSFIPETYWDYLEAKRNYNNFSKKY